MHARLHAHYLPCGHRLAQMAATSAQAELRAAYQLAKELHSCDAAVNLAYIMLCESADGTHGSGAGPPTGGRNDDALKEALTLLWEATTASTSEAAKREAWYLLGLTHEYASALHPPSPARRPYCAYLAFGLCGGRACIGYMDSLGLARQRRLEHGPCT